MTDLARFIVLSHGRTGSTYLAKEVNRSADIRMQYEIFHPSFDQRDLVNGKRYVNGEDSWQFVSDNLYANQPPRIRSAGFKLFYYHARGEGPESRIWEEFPKQKDIDIILLGRKNIFAAFVSEARARATNVWHPSNDKTNVYDQQVAISIEIEAARRYMNRTMRFREQGLELAIGHRTHSVNYEDFVTDSVGSLRSLVKFLGSQDEAFTPNPFMTGSADKSKTVIQNFSEVEAMLRDLDCEWMAQPYQ